MGTSVLSYSSADIDTSVDYTQAYNSASETPPRSEIGSTDWQAESSSSLTPYLADMTPSSSTDSEESLALSYNTHTKNVSRVLPSYSSAPSSTGSLTGKNEAPMLTYSSSPTLAGAGDGQGIVNTAEPLFYTSSALSSIDYTPENVREAPMLNYSSSPASGYFEDGQSTVSSSPFHSSAPTADSSAAIGSMTLADQEAPCYVAAVSTFTATESKEVSSYSLIPYPAGNEKGVALFYSSGPAFYNGGSSSEGPSGVVAVQSGSENIRALFYSSVPSNDIEADNADVKLPFSTATPSDTDTEYQESQFYTLPTSASNSVPSYYLTNFPANTKSSKTPLPRYMPQAHYEGPFDPVERDAIEMSAWTIETADNVTTETDPRWYRLDNPPNDIVKGSDDWYYYTMYDCSTQTYYFPNGETQFFGIPPPDLTDSSTSENYADSSTPSYTATPSYDGTILNPNSSSSAESTSAGLLDLPSPKLTVQLRLVSVDLRDNVFIVAGGTACRVWANVVTTSSPPLGSWVVCWAITLTASAYTLDSSRVASTISWAAHTLANSSSRPSSRSLLVTLRLIQLIFWFSCSDTILSTIDEWSRLPGLLEQQLLSLCAINDLWRFRAVCKRWNSLICAPECGKFRSFRNANEDARYIIGRIFDQHFEASYTDIDSSALKYIKVVGWKIFDLKERRWYTWKRPLLNTYSNDHPLVSDEGLIVLCGSATMAAANDHPLASDGGFVVCCSILPGTAIISEIIITNPTVMTKMVLPMPVPWNNLYLSSFLVNLAVDRISQAYKIFLINRYEDPFLCVFDSTTNQWRVSRNPPVRQLHDGVGAQAHSVIFQEQLYVLFKTYRAPGSIEGWLAKFWLHRYNFLEDSWADCGVDFPEWPDNGTERKELVVSGNRLFVVSGYTLQLDTRHGLIRMLDPLSVFEILLADSTLVTEFHLAEPSFNARGLEVDGPTYEFFDTELEEMVDVRSFQFNHAFGFGNSIMHTYRWLGFSIVYDVETRLWELLPTDPTVELYGNVMPLRPPRTSGEPISGEL